VRALLESMLREFGNSSTCWRAGEFRRRTAAMKSHGHKANPLGFVTVDLFYRKGHAICWASLGGSSGGCRRQAERRRKTGTDLISSRWTRELSSGAWPDHSLHGW